MKPNSYKPYSDRVLITKDDYVGKIHYDYEIKEINKGEDTYYNLLIAIDWTVMKDLSSSSFDFLRNYAIGYIEWLHWMSKVMRECIWYLY